MMQFSSAKAKRGSIMLGITFLLLLGAVLIMGWWTYTRISTPTTAVYEKEASSDYAAIVDFVKKNPFSFSLPENRTSAPALFHGKDNLTFLIAGVPGSGNPAPNLTDSLILVNIRLGFTNKEIEQVSLLSIPRDLFVVVPGEDFRMRINSIYQYFLPQGKEAALERLKSVTSEVTGVTINHVALVDLSVLAEVIDLLGGVYVQVREPIDDPRFPGPRYSYEPFYLEKGWRWLDGQTAIKYVRTRYDPRGDFSRSQRQQQVINSIQQKLNNMSVVEKLPTLWSIYKKLEPHIVTDISLTQALELWRLTRGISADIIKEQSLTSDEDNVLASEQIKVASGQIAWVLRPRSGWGDYSQIHQLVREFFNGK